MNGITHLVEAGILPPILTIVLGIIIWLKMCLIARGYRIVVKYTKNFSSIIIDDYSSITEEKYEKLNEHCFILISITFIFAVYVIYSFSILLRAVRLLVLGIGTAEFWTSLIFEIIFGIIIEEIYSHLIKQFYKKYKDFIIENNDKSNKLEDTKRV